MTAERPPLLIASGNAHKVDEFRRMFAEVDAFPYRVVSARELGFEAPEVDEDGASFEDNACKKAEVWASQSALAVLADDSGLEVDALEGAPGVYSARYAGEGATDAQNRAKLLSALEGIAEEERSARFRCVLVLVDPRQNTRLVVDGRCEGRIALAERGQGGFGYDPLFLPQGEEQTFAEIDASQKDQLSHRGRALRGLIRRLCEG